MTNRRGAKDENDNEYDGSPESIETAEARINPHSTDYAPLKGHHEPSADRERRRSFIDEDREAGLQVTVLAEKEKPVSWMDLPYKSQLAILTVSRLAEPLVFSSLRVSFQRKARRELGSILSHLGYDSRKILLTL